MARLGEVAREMFLGRSTTVGESDMITVVELVGASHWVNDGQQVSINATVKPWSSNAETLDAL